MPPLHRRGRLALGLLLSLAAHASAARPLAAPVRPPGPAAPLRAPVPAGADVGESIKRAALQTTALTAPEGVANTFLPAVLGIESLSQALLPWTPLLPPGDARDLRERVRRDVARAESPEIESVQFARALMRAKSDAIEMLFDGQSETDPLVLDAAVIGAGSNAAAFVGALNSTLETRTLVFEAGDEHHFGTFDALGSAFRVNTGEFENATGNPFRMSMVQVKDLAREQEKFVAAKKLGDATVLAHYSNGSNVLFNSRIVGARPVALKNELVYELTRQDGRKFYSRFIVPATGFGEPLGLKDPATARFMAAEKARVARAEARGDFAAFGRIEPVDETLRRANHASLQGRDPLAPYHGKRVIIAGKGDGGKIAAEFFSNAAPNTILSPSRVKSIIWLGQDAATIEEFEAKEERKERYVPTIAEVYKRFMKPLKGRLKSAEPLPDGGVLVAYSEDKEGKSLKELVGDILVLCLGYTNNVTKMLDGLAGAGASLLLEPVYGTIKDLPGGALEGVIARRVVGHPNIIAIGGASDLKFDMDIPSDEYQQRAGGFLDHLSARAVEVAHIVAERLRARRALASPE